MQKTNPNKAASIFLLMFVIAFTMVMPPSLASAEQATPVDYHPPGGEHWNKLRDIKLKDSAWGYGATATENVYLGQNARKVETNGFWADQLVVNGWQSFDVGPYYKNGRLEFDIVGKDGGESFKIGFRDVVHERLDSNGDFYKDNDNHPEETNLDALVNVNDYIQVTREWQHAAIPIKDIFDSNPLFDGSKIQLFKMTGNDTPITFWITNVKVTSPDTERSYAPIKVNQVGYLNYGEKYAHVSGYYNVLSADVGTPFQVKRTSDDSVVYSGALALVAAYDELSGEKVLKADFSRLNDIGEYYITVDGVAEKSVPFEIGPHIYDNLLNDVQKFFYFQRANVDLLPKHAGIFARTGLHKDDANLPLRSNPSVTKDVYGGWWDAGDMGKYVTAAATAVSDLLWAYESFPHKFTDGQLNIPESGNGISDLLDEIKVETDFFLKMQEKTSGGFYAYVLREPSPNRFIIDGNGPESIIPTAQTATTVGALAHAYIVFKDVPGLEDYANTLLASAVRGWDYLKAHPEFIPQPKDPKNDNGPYYDDDDKNDRFYAAAVLYRATGEARYNDYVVANYKAFESKFEKADFSHGIGSMEQIGFYHYLSSSAPSEEVKAWFVPKYKEWIKKVINSTTHEAVWRNSTNKGFYWGANSNIASVAISLDIGSRIIGEYDERMIQVASGNLNYLLGINPLQLSFITGYGENRVHITHHEVYMRDFIKEMPNGYMPGGPNNNGKFNFSAKAYNQATVDWESNEQALNYNSPLIYLTALLTDVPNKTFSESIQLDSKSSTFVIGETKKVTATVMPTEAYFKRLQVTSADESVAKVTNIVYNEGAGLTSFDVTAIKQGNTEIKVQSIDGRINAKYQAAVVSGSGSSSGSGSGSSSSSGSSSGTTDSNPKQDGTVPLTRESLEKAARSAVNGKITISVNIASGLKKVVVELPGDWIQTLDTASIKSISIEALGSTVELDQAFLKKLTKDGAGKLAIGIALVASEGLSGEVRALAGDSPVYDFTLTLDNARVQWTNHPVTVKIPYKLEKGKNPNQVVVYNVDNRPEVVNTGLFDKGSGKIVFLPKHFSQYTVVYKNVDFGDIGALSSLTSDSIRAIAARGVIVGKEPGKYDPQGKLTRAEFVQMLVNLFDVADPAAASKLTDVKEGAWYYKAVGLAEKLGIVQGKTDGSFGINDVLTRQDMAVLLHRALLVSGYSLPLNEKAVPAFADEEDISVYAKKEVEALKQAKALVADANGSYGPKSPVDRAEAAVLISNFLQIVNN
ncbi:glycoside hydrolase family 9 protein [Paenibacillus sp. SI8]|uniref:glycoside hydrolase family 9 protein n=1 Tax=unclassified Paenibacillus TaxID=185978 RepID=UPI0034676F3A